MEKEISTQQGQVPGPAEPKGKEDFREQRRKQKLSEVSKVLSDCIAEDQHLILEAAIEQVHRVSDKASRLRNLKDRVYEIYDRLDVKSKAAITALQELAGLEGCSVGVDFGYELLYVTGRDKVCIEQARAELPDDPDIAVLAEAYELSSFINQAV